MNTPLGHSGGPNEANHDSGPLSHHTTSQKFEGEVIRQMRMGVKHDSQATDLHPRNCARFQSTALEALSCRLLTFGIFGDCPPI